MKDHPELGTILPKSIIEYMDKYKKTKDPKYFFRVIVVLDKLLLRIIHQKRRRYKVLRMVEGQELYHISILCLHNVMNKFDVRRSSIYSLPRYLSGNIDNAFKKLMRDNDKYIASGVDVTTFEGIMNGMALSNNSKEWFSRKMIIDDACKRIIQKADDKQRMRRDIRILCLREVDGYTCAEVSKKYGISIERVRIIHKNTLDKLRHEVGGCRE